MKKIGAITHIGLGHKAGQRNKVQKLINASPYRGGSIDEISRGLLFRPPTKRSYLLPLEAVDIGLGGDNEEVSWSLSEDGTINITVEDPEEAGCVLHALGFENGEPWLYTFGKNRIQFWKGASVKGFHVGIHFENLRAIKGFQEEIAVNTPGVNRFGSAIAAKKKDVRRTLLSGSFFVKMRGIGAEFTFGRHGLAEHFREKVRGVPERIPSSPYAAFSPLKLSHP